MVLRNIKTFFITYIFLFTQLNLSLYTNYSATGKKKNLVKVRIIGNKVFAQTSSLSSVAKSESDQFKDHYLPMLVMLGIGLTSLFLIRNLQRRTADSTVFFVAAIAYFASIVMGWTGENKKFKELLEEIDTDTQVGALKAQKKSFEEVRDMAKKRLTMQYAAVAGFAAATVMAITAYSRDRSTRTNTQTAIAQLAAEIPVTCQRSPEVIDPRINADVRTGVPLQASCNNTTQVAAVEVAQMQAAEATSVAVTEQVAFHGGSNEGNSRLIQADNKTSLRGAGIGLPQKRTNRFENMWMTGVYSFLDNDPKKDRHFLDLIFNFVMKKIYARQPGLDEVSLIEDAASVARTETNVSQEFMMGTGCDGDQHMVRGPESGQCVRQFYLYNSTTPRPVRLCPNASEMLGQTALSETPDSIFMASRDMHSDSYTQLYGRNLGQLAERVTSLDCFNVSAQEINDEQSRIFADSPQAITIVPTATATITPVPVTTVLETQAVPSATRVNSALIAQAKQEDYLRAAYPDGERIQVKDTDEILQPVEVIQVEDSVPATEVTQGAPATQTLTPSTATASSNTSGAFAEIDITQNAQSALSESSAQGAREVDRWIFNPKGRMIVFSAISSLTTFISLNTKKMIDNLEEDIKQLDELIQAMESRQVRFKDNIQLSPFISSFMNLLTPSVQAKTNHQATVLPYKLPCLIPHPKTKRCLNVKHVINKTMIPGAKYPKLVTNIAYSLGVVGNSLSNNYQINNKTMRTLNVMATKASTMVKIESIYKKQLNQSLKRKRAKQINFKGYEQHFLSRMSKITKQSYNKFNISVDELKSLGAVNFGSDFIHKNTLSNVNKTEQEERKVAMLDNPESNFDITNDESSSNTNRVKQRSNDDYYIDQINKSKEKNIFSIISNRYMLIRQNRLK